MTMVPARCPSWRLPKPWRAVARVPGDATTSGVAMLAGLGVGIYPDAESAIAVACRPEPAIEPDLANHDRYEAIYDHYRAIVASTTLHARASSAPVEEQRSQRQSGERA